MDLVHGIVNVFTPSNLLFCFLGCVLGTLVGVLPGLGTASTLAILLPLTTYWNPTAAIIMLAGLYYGAQYGGSTTSILVNIPGEAASVVTCLDGFQMTKQGRAGEALWIAAVGSFLAGTIAAVAISFVGPAIALYALKFGPPEYFGLIVLSLTTLVSLSGDSVMRGVSAGIIGITLATVGIDPMTGVGRFNYGGVSFLRGFDIVPLVVGLFGIAEILISAEEGLVKIYEGELGHMMPHGAELKKGMWAALRGTVSGFLLGLLPGVAPALASWLAYDLEKRISKDPKKFGTGAIEGVAAPEAANNAAAQAGFIPLMALGIPTSPSWAIILAVLLMYGLQPGPILFQMNKELIWTVLGSLYVGNVILLVLNLPLVGLWARISKMPYKYLGPTILGICVIGAYSSRNTMFDVWVAFGAGLLGYIMRKTGWPTAPLILGLILGPMLEQALRQSISMGGPFIFFSRPIAATFLCVTVVVIGFMATYLKRVPKEVLKDDSST